MTSAPHAHGSSDSSFPGMDLRTPSQIIIMSDSLPNHHPSEPVLDSESMLSTTTVPSYVGGLGLFAANVTLSASEIAGGNLNYAFCVRSSEAPEGERSAVFVKQTPGYVKVLGPAAVLSAQRLHVERQAYAEWQAAAPGSDCLPEVLHFDDTRCVCASPF